VLPEQIILLPIASKPVVLFGILVFSSEAQELSVIYSMSPPGSFLGPSSSSALTPVEPISCAEAPTERTETSLSDSFCSGVGSLSERTCVLSQRSIPRVGANLRRLKGRWRAVRPQKIKVTYTAMQPALFSPNLRTSRRPKSRQSTLSYELEAMSFSMRTAGYG
jgi:hypothetical protein